MRTQNLTSNREKILFQENLSFRTYQISCLLLKLIQALLVKSRLTEVLPGLISTFFNIHSDIMNSFRLASKIICFLLRFLKVHSDLVKTCYNAFRFGEDLFKLIWLKLIPTPSGALRRYSASEDDLLKLVKSSSKAIQNYPNPFKAH